MGDFFQNLNLAALYSEARPYFHPYVISLVRDTLKMKHKFPLALDVACGTGQSSRALLEIAECVVGIDVSRAMLQHAYGAPNLIYQKSKAEQLNFPDESLEFMTVGQAFHWFHRQHFYLEASRVLKPKGYLVIYTHALKHECLLSFYEKFPSPFKNQPKIINEISFFEFESLHQIPYSNQIQLTQDQVINYTMSLSSVEEKLKSQSEDEIRKEIVEMIKPNSNENFLSVGEVWIIQKNSH
ncbi:MAG: class I SAM-dependent methyltransferase [Bacteriovoracaceae bacterium]|nr:class I SAM-dependent methyltransferase [Bacteriovoracaceae bacterium]